MWTLLCAEIDSVADNELAATHLSQYPVIFCQDVSTSAAFSSDILYNMGVSFTTHKRLPTEYLSCMQFNIHSCLT